MDEAEDPGMTTVCTAAELWVFGTEIIDLECGSHKLLQHEVGRHGLGLVDEDEVQKLPGDTDEERCALVAIALR